MDEGPGLDLDAFLTKETPRLLSCALVLTGNTHDAWDLVQESLVRVAQRWHRLHAGNPGGYAMTVLVRLNIDRFRRARRELIAAFPYLHVRESEIPVVTHYEPDSDVIGMLDSLTAQQRSVVALKFFCDLDIEDIAVMLGCSESTARSHLSRGLQRLRPSVEPYSAPTVATGGDLRE